MAKLYHLYIRKAKGGLKKLTGYAMTHSECCTMKSKFSASEQSRILFVEGVRLKPSPPPHPTSKLKQATLNTP